MSQRNPPTRHLLVWLTSTVDHRDHAVTDADLEVGCTAGQGAFLALCGDTVDVGSMYDLPAPAAPDAVR